MFSSLSFPSSNNPSVQSSKSQKRSRHDLEQQDRQELDASQRHEHYDFHDARGHLTQFADAYLSRHTNHESFGKLDELFIADLARIHSDTINRIHGHLQRHREEDLEEIELYKSKLIMSEQRASDYLDDYNAAVADQEVLEFENCYLHDHLEQLKRDNAKLREESKEMRDSIESVKKHLNRMIGSV